MPRVPGTLSVIMFIRISLKRIQKRSQSGDRMFKFVTFGCNYLSNMISKDVRWNISEVLTEWQISMNAY